MYANGYCRKEKGMIVSLSFKTSKEGSNLIEVIIILSMCLFVYTSSKLISDLNRNVQEKEKELMEQMKSRIAAGWAVYRNGDKINANGIGSISLEAYKVALDEELKIINLIPKKGERTYRLEINTYKEV